MNSRLISGAWFSHAGVAFIVGLLALGGCSTAILKNSPGTTFGEIFVGPPRVTGRERLINDRLREDGWLRGQLDTADSRSFGFSGYAEQLSTRRVSVNASLQADPTQINQYLSSAAAAKEQTDQTRELNQLIFENRKAMLAKDKATIEQGGSPTYFQYVATAGATVKASDPLSTPVGPDTNAGSSSSKLTAPPDPQTIAQAFSQTDPREEFRDRLSLREMIRDEIIGNGLDESHDLKGNTLYRLGFDVGILPQNDTSAWAVVEATIQAADDEYAQLPGKPLAQLETTLRDQINEDILRLLSLGAPSLDIDCVENTSNTNENDPPICGPRLRDQVKTGLILQAEEMLQKCSEPNGFRANRPQGERGLTRGQLLGYDLESYMKALTTCRKEKKSQVFAKLVKAYVAKSYNDSYNLTLCQHASCETNGPSNLISEIDLSDKLRDIKPESANIYAYAVTPKETVQRISEVATRRVAYDYILGLQARAGNSVSGNILSSLFEENQGLFDVIKRQPLVFGYSHARDGAANAAPGTTFGWIVGPRYTIADNGRSARFRQGGVQHNVAAYVSMPGWWKRAKVTVKTRWYSEKDAWQQPDSRMTETGNTRTFIISLPGEIKALADAMRVYDAKIPVPDELLEPIAVRVGEAASIVIPGRNLWRNTYVTLGGQRNTSIEVLPDMGGIIATWDKVEAPNGLRPDKFQGYTVPIIIWTSDGHTKLARRATVEGASTGASAQDAVLSSQRLYPGALATITLSGAAAQDKRYTVRFVEAGGSSPSTKTVIPDLALVQDTPGQMKFTIPADFKAPKDGTVVAAIITVTGTTGTLPQSINASGKAVLYTSADSADFGLADVNIRAPQGRTLATLKFTLPAQVQIAYGAGNAFAYDLALNVNTDNGVWSSQKNLALSPADCKQPLNGQSTSCTITVSLPPGEAKPTSLDATQEWTWRLVLKRSAQGPALSLSRDLKLNAQQKAAINNRLSKIK